MKTIRNLAILAFIALAFDLAFYAAMTQSLCNRIDTFTAEAQASMKLDASTCALPWYKKL